MGGNGNKSPAKKTVNNKNNAPKPKNTVADVPKIKFDKTGQGVLF